MFRFLFGKSKATPGEVVRETQRETLVRALGEVNEIVARLDPKPPVTFDPATGAISFDLPDQMPDEAKALPAPDPAPTVAAAAAAEAGTPAEDKPATAAKAGAA